LTVSQLEYSIRKGERGLFVLRAYININDVKSQSYLIDVLKQRGREVAFLRKQLFLLTGSANPKTPRWPI
jgi:hypothetical protein